MKNEDVRWKDLPIGLLIGILGKVGLESLLLSVPFVCKSWYKASLDPSCWENLIFPQISSAHDSLYELKVWLKLTLDPSFFESLVFPKASRISYYNNQQQNLSFLERFNAVYRIHDCSASAFVKFVVSRSQGKCSLLLIPGFCNSDILEYIATECPLLRTLSFGTNVYQSGVEAALRKVIGNWKYLENLALGRHSNLIDIIPKISNKNFANLYVTGAIMRQQETSAIVTEIPNVKYLFLRRSKFQQDSKHIQIVLKRCKELVHLDVGFSSNLVIDCDMIKLAQNVRTFNYAYSSPGLSHVVDDVYDCSDQSYL